MKNFPSVNPDTIQVIKRRKVISNLKDKVFKLLKETQLTDDDYNAKLGLFKTYLRSVRTLINENALDDAFDIACDKGIIKILNFNFVLFIFQVCMNMLSYYLEEEQTLTFKQNQCLKLPILATPEC